MGLFDKKYCDICGEKIGLLGNRKLEDGNLCKDCARKLSPFFNERRHSTVEEIKQQLAYRKENEAELSNFHPDMIFGESRKVYADTNGGRFIVTSASNWRGVNPDLISFSQVTGVNTDIHENKNEIYYKDEQGNRKSYNPCRYECSYEFNVTIFVNSPWFDKIELELSDGNRPDSPYTDLYRKYEGQMHTLSDVLKGKKSAMGGYMPQNSEPSADAHSAREQEIIADVIKNSTWLCAECGLANPGTSVCQGCGAKVNDENLLKTARTLARATILQESLEKNNGNAANRKVCPFCGSQSSGKFCENCGASLT